MLKVGLTGGIGSGKSTVASIFEILGIPVFYADQSARDLMDHSVELQESIRQLLGDDVLRQGTLDRNAIAKTVFNRPDLLEALNALVHPLTFKAAEDWISSQKSPYIIKEAAILFESGANKTMDLVIGVQAPEELRIIRTMRRNHLDREAVITRIARQMPEDEKMALCDYVITNDDIKAVLPQVLSIHQKILERTGS